jgi:V-type H+-transporting ATPase subunit E
VNKLRLEKFKVKIDYINSIFEETRTALSQRIKSKPEDYKKTMKNLIVESLIKLLDENVNVICKKEDVILVKSLLEPAKEEFLNLLKKNSNKFKNFELNLTLDSKYFLPDNM